MKKSLTMLVLNPAFWVQLTLASLASAQTVDQVIPHKVKVESVEYLGKQAVKITEDGQVADGGALGRSTEELDTRVFLNQAVQVYVLAATAHHIKPAKPAAGHFAQRAQHLGVPGGETEENHIRHLSRILGGASNGPVTGALELTVDARGHVAGQKQVGSVNG